MNLNTILNEYQYDWAISPVIRKKFPKEKLNNKIIAIASEDEHFASCLIYSFLLANDIHNLNMTIIFLKKDSHIESENIKKLLSRNDLNFKTINNIKNDINFKSIDYFLYTGCCTIDIINSPDFLIERIQNTRQYLKVASKMNIKKFILLSDYRSYGKVRKGKCISEFEKGELNYIEEYSIQYQIIQTIENLSVSYAKKYNFDYIILRPGIILGANTNLSNNIFTDIFKSVANNSEHTIVNSINKYSFVYISDLINAIYYSITKLQCNTVYNVVGKDSTVSTGMMSAMIHDTLGESCKINLIRSEKEPNYGVNLNNQKIIINGCKPKIKLIDAIDLIIKSEKKSNKPFIFDDIFLGNLKTIQNILLGYMLEVDKICKKHNIKYFLAGGTLLGAIRHKGFIPWDDDADIMMLRVDYEKFLKIAPLELPDNIKLQTPQIDKEYHNILAKLRIDNTSYATKWTVNFPKMNNGIFFDIISHDNTSNNKIGRKIHLKSTILTRALVFNKWNNRNIENNSKIESVISNTLKKVMSLSLAEKLQFKSLEWYKNKTNSKYLFDGMGRNIYKGDFPKEYLRETIYWDFEGHKFPVPKEYDKYLKYLYGNYRDLVIASKRKNSHSIVLSDLGEYSNYDKYKQT